MDGVETLWQELITTALLGTERRPPAPSAAGGRLGELLGQLDAADGPHFLLGESALLEKYRQAGLRPRRFDPQPLPPCEPEEWERCGGAAAARLAALLAGDPYDLLPEWLAWAASSYKRVPEELLVDLLGWGEQHSDQVDRLLPVLGRRGHWLVQMAPWAGQVAAASSAARLPLDAVPGAWRTERKSVRRRLLARLRAARPAEARQMLESTWKEEGAEERAAFLELLETGLSLADEPFLETALDDRSKEVRRQAAQLLSRLPDSRLVHRQLERAQACLEWKAGGFLRKAQIEVALPERCDAGMLRDGIEPKRPLQQHGEKAGWLLQILGCVPPAVWSRAWGRSPAELIAAASGDWQELLYEGWIAATLRHPDAEWAAALLKEYSRPELLAAIPAGQRAAFLAGLFQAGPREAMDLLIGYESPWGPELTRLFIRSLRAYSLRLPGMPSQAAFVRFARFMDPGLAAEAAKLLAEKADPDSAWERAVETMLRLLDARRQMMEELI